MHWSSSNHMSWRRAAAVIGLAAGACVAGQTAAHAEDRIPTETVYEGGTDVFIKSSGPAVLTGVVVGYGANGKVNYNVVLPSSPPGNGFADVPPNDVSIVAYSGDCVYAPSKSSGPKAGSSSSSQVRAPSRAAPSTRDDDDTPSGTMVSGNSYAYKDKAFPLIVHVASLGVGEAQDWGSVVLFDWINQLQGYAVVIPVADQPSVATASLTIPPGKLPAGSGLIRADYSGSEKLGIAASSGCLFVNVEPLADGDPGAKNPPQKMRKN